MHQAYFYHGLKAPIDGSVSCDVLAAQGEAAGLFVTGKDLERGNASVSDLGACSLFLRRRTATDWTHTGFVVNLTQSRGETVFTTIEGNTNDEGSREGFEACRRTRALKAGNYDFVRLG